jgi:hypothetical protein
MRCLIVITFLISNALVAGAQDDQLDDGKKMNPQEEKLVWNPRVFDFKEIPKGKPVKATFKYVNNGKDNLHITKVVSSCGCTVAEFSADPVKPGGSGELTATFDAAKYGGFHKMITVHISDETHYKLYLKGTVGSKPPKAGESK